MAKRKKKSSPLGSPREKDLQSGTTYSFFDDPKIKALAKAKQRRAQRLIIGKKLAGSNMQLSNQLRWYFQEYANRFWNWGSGSLPSSFNVVEAFMRFDAEYLYFDLNEEIEHLLSIDDYWTWYAEHGSRGKLKSLISSMKEGVIYSYEMLSESNGFRIKKKFKRITIHQVIAGISLVRRRNQLSCVMIAGENPPLHSEAEIKEIIGTGKHFPGREGIEPHTDYSIEDSYLESFPGFSKTIILGRFDLESEKYDVRYINVDEGKSFNVLTDDPVILTYLKENSDYDFERTMATDLERYDSLFSALASLIFIPLYFSEHAGKVTTLNVVTELKSKSRDEEVKKVIHALGKEHSIFERCINILPISSGSQSDEWKIKPPEMSFLSEGYWKPIGPQELGEDQDGNPVIGRTWVSRKDMWSEKKLGSYMIERSEESEAGEDPGEIYVQRTESNERDVYKIGLTRRSSEKRSKELSSATGVATPFFVLCSWRVKNCSAVEKIVHERLKNHRMNPKREFFLANLKIITSTIKEVIDEIDK